MHHWSGVFRDFPLMGSSSHLPREFDKNLQIGWQSQLGKAKIVGRHPCYEQREPQSDQVAFPVLVLVRMPAWTHGLSEYEPSLRPRKRHLGWS